MSEGVATRIKKSILKIDTVRMIVQFVSFLLLNAVMFGLGPWLVLLPVLGTLGVPQKTVGESLGALQWMFYNSIFPWLALASIFLTAVIFGRALCAWVCPFGFVQDLLRTVKRKHTQVSLRTHSWMINIKYFILAAVLFISGSTYALLGTGSGSSYKEALGVFAKSPFNTLSPADTLFAILPRIIMQIRYAIPLFSQKTVSEIVFSVPPLLWTRLSIMVLILVLAVYVPRSWCQYFCPQGAFLGLLNRFSFLGLRRNPLKCTKVGCRACVQVCPMKVRIFDLPWEKFADPECIYCLKCVEACATKAIKPKFP